MSTESAPGVNASSKPLPWHIIAPALAGVLCLCLGLTCGLPLGYWLNKGNVAAADGPQGKGGKVASKNNDKSIDDLIAHLRAKGIQVERESNPPMMVGLGITRTAKVGEGAVFLMKLDSENRAESDELRSCAEKGYRDLNGSRMRVEVNGSFVISVTPNGHPQRKEIEAAFMSF